jgi:hypothetical protein
VIAIITTSKNFEREVYFGRRLQGQQM